MEMIVHLEDEIFDLVKNGTKTIEGRLNDEKRRKLSIGDKLVFINRKDNNKFINAIINNLIYYDTFEEMTESFSIDKLYDDKYSKEDYLKLIRQFYSDEDVKKYGVVAILFNKID